MRRATGLLLAAALLAGCTASPPDKPAPTAPGPAPGCGIVQRSRVVGLLGKTSEATLTGSVAALRDRHVRVTCTTTVPGHSERYVSVVADYHPTPFTLPRRGCSEGWVYAGTPDKYTPACQDTVAGHGRTQLFVRWQPYLMHVTIGRSDKNWGGDPEVALAMSRALAQELGVRDATGDG